MKSVYLATREATKKWSMPIPQVEIDANPMCEQNPGY
jgi:hypothetical protein